MALKDITLPDFYETNIKIIYLQNKPVNISETVLMFEISFQQFDIL